jgi:hypothetical protein
MGAETNPYEPHIVSTGQIAKAYRETFKRHRIVRTDDKHTPPLFRHDFMDTSTEHDNHADATIPAGYQPDVQTGYAYLALLHEAEWPIVGYGSVDGDSIRYPSVVKNVIYLPVYYANGQQSPAGAPFYVNSDGKIHSFETAPPDTLLTFRAIAPYDDRPFLWRMMGGSFEGADNPGFSGAVVLHTIKNVPDAHNTITLNTPACYRYVRYKSPDGSFGNVTEIVFLDVNGKKLQGKHIGTPGSWNDQGTTGDKAFDGDVMTFYEAKDRNGAWTGLDMERQQCISAIQYMPRLENFIYAGHKYELFYWAENGWKSQDIQTSSGTELTFRIPRNSLCYIYNHTIRTKGQPFIQKDNDVIFYYGVL